MARSKKSLDLGVEVGGTEVIPFAAGLELPAKINYWPSNAHGFDVQLRIAFQDGRYECVSLEVSQRAGGSVVTGEAIRRLTIREYVREALSEFLTMEVGISEEIDGFTPPAGIAAKGATEEVLRWVSQIYELAYAMNEAPTKAVQEKFEVSRATAGRWVADARREGFINIEGDDSGQHQ